MPYSSEHGKGLVDRALLRLHHDFNESNPFFRHHKILDIGAGSGTYSRLYSNSLLKRPNFTWEAVEIWEPYIHEFKLNDFYDSVHNVDAREFLKTTKDVYDIIFMGDVIEHMSKEEATELVNLAQKVSNLVIISVPIVHYPQTAEELQAAGFDNPYEVHVKDDWSVDEMLQTFGDNIVFHGVEEEIGVFFIEDANLCEQTLRNVFAPKIGIYAIGKNEMKFAMRFMDSVLEADQVVICDTGSTDGTFEFIQNLNRGHVIARQIAVMPFRFDDARNAAMSLLRPDIDVCVSIDFDEYMEFGWSEVLREEALKDLQSRGHIVDRWNHRFQTIWNWEKSDQGMEEPTVSDHWHERIHTRNNYLWKLPVHEVLVKVANGPEEIKWLGGFTQIQKPDNEKSRSSYLPMLEISVKEDPKRWKTWSFLAGDLFNSGRHHEAFNAIETAKKCDGADVAYLCNQKSRLHSQIGQVREAVAEMMNACMISPHLREYKVYAARIHKDAGDTLASQSMFKMAEAITERTYGYEYDPSVWGESFEELRKELGL